MERRNLIRPAVAALAVFIGLGAVAQADITLRATFLEQHNWDNLGNPSDSKNTDVDALTDLWTLSLVGIAPAGSFSIDKVEVVLPSLVIYDTGAGSPGKNDAFPFGGPVATGLTNTDASVAGKTLTMMFSGFDAVSDAFAYSIDVDNSNAVVRGYWGSSDHGAIGGNSLLGSNGNVAWGNLSNSALLNVSYTSNGVAKTASGHFFGWNGPSGGSVHNAMAQVNLAVPVPAPAAAGLVLIGMPIVGWVKRRFA